MGAATGLVVAGFNHLVHKTKAPEAVESSESGDCLTCPDPTNYSEGAIYEHWFDSSMYKLVDGVWVECPTCKPVVRVVGGAGSLEVIGGAGKGIIKGIDWGIKAVKGLFTAEKTFKTADALIQAAGSLTKVKAGLQGFVKGDGPSIFKAITKDGTLQANGQYLMENGMQIGSHLSKTTGAYTIHITPTVGKMIKIRITP